MTAAERLPDCEVPDGLHLVGVSAAPSIMVLGKANCGKCESAKKKLSDYFKMAFGFVEVDNPSDWRGTDAVDVLASAQVKGIDHTHPPIIGINGEAFEYAEAMKELKAILA